MFLSRNNISFILPGRNNQVYVGKGDDGKCQYKRKTFLLWTFQELVGLLKEEEDDSRSPISFTTLYMYKSSHLKNAWEEARSHNYIAYIQSARTLNFF